MMEGNNKITHLATLLGARIRIDGLAVNVAARELGISQGYVLILTGYVPLTP